MTESDLTATRAAARRAATLRRGRPSTANLSPVCGDTSLRGFAETVRTSRTSSRTRSSPSRAHLGNRSDELAAGHGLLLSGLTRYAKPNPAGDLFDYEIAR